MLCWSGCEVVVLLSERSARSDASALAADVSCGLIRFGEVWYALARYLGGLLYPRRAAGGLPRGVGYCAIILLCDAHKLKRFQDVVYHLAICTAWERF